ncbi:hypothetical protein [Actinomadura flavalba]|uniref:hypothetical protein n=1 Tax=Actinomadura flavalba TaxID=1120938 RepID=UPI00035D53BF|nr:hypothetical protein [Actinomadura flavalba]
MTADDHAAEVDALRRRFPGWAVWFGRSTRHWWALPPRGRGPADFVEADTAQRLIARIEAIRAGAETPAHATSAQVGTVPRAVAPDGRPPPHDPRDDTRRPSNLLRIEGTTPSPSHRVPMVAWPGSTAR